MATVQNYVVKKKYISTGFVFNTTEISSMSYSGKISHSLLPSLVLDSSLALNI